MISLLALSLPLLTSFLLSNSVPTSENKSISCPPTSTTLIDSARLSLHNNDTDAAYNFLTQAYAQNANSPGLMACFEQFFRVKIKLQDDPSDTRMGLASLLLDQSRYEDAAKELRQVVVSVEEGTSTKAAFQEKAFSMLFRTQAAICDWKDYEKDSDTLVNFVRSCLNSSNETIPAMHPFESLMWPCITLNDATRIANRFAIRAMKSVSSSVTTDANSFQSGSKVKTRTKGDSVPFVEVRSRRQSRPITTDGTTTSQKKKIKLGYISPDFTGKHPLAFLMQDVFRFHDTSRFDLHIYSQYESDGSSEVEKIKKAANHKWRVFSSSKAGDLADIIRDDDLDILVDLCGYTGTSLIAEVMAHRVAPVQIGYMGFPASTGAPFIDYMICDETVVPSCYRESYSESLIVMPHCYFVNSHRFLSPMSTTTENLYSRAEYGLPDTGFIFCCHSRPDKIDPSTFRSWVQALMRIRKEGAARDGDGGCDEKKENAILWLLRSGDEMEESLRTLANTMGLSNECLVFADKVPRNEHLERLKLADLFLDTPAYNAHTVGCDCLSSGVPMLSLLRPDSMINNELVPTEKLASRVGASLLRSVELDDLIVPSMTEYEAMMVRCATDHDWFSSITEKLKVIRHNAPLFDTERWVKNLEAGLIDISQNNERQDTDVYIIDE